MTVIRVTSNQQNSCNKRLTNDVAIPRSVLSSTRRGTCFYLLQKSASICVHLRLTLFSSAPLRLCGESLERDHHEPCRRRSRIGQLVGDAHGDVLHLAR